MYLFVVGEMSRGKNLQGGGGRMLARTQQVLRDHSIVVGRNE